MGSYSKSLMAKIETALRSALIIETATSSTAALCLDLISVMPSASWLGRHRKTVWETWEVHVRVAEHGRGGSVGPGDHDAGDGTSQDRDATLRKCVLKIIESSLDRAGVVPMAGVDSGKEALQHTFDVR